MLKRFVRKTHKWVAVATSLVLFAWLVSGILMVMPVDWLARRAGLATAPASWSPPEYRQVQVTIPQAIAALEAELGRSVEVMGVQVTTYQDRPVYQISVGGGLARLVDAISGQPIVITESMAKDLARGAVPGARIASSSRIEANDYHFFGPFPAYKFVLEEPAGSVIYVSATGAIRRTTTLSRTRRWITSLHEFEPLNAISRSRALQIGALILFSGLALLVLASGLYLALPTRRRRLSSPEKA